MATYLPAKRVPSAGLRVYPEGGSVPLRACPPMCISRLRRLLPLSATIFVAFSRLHSQAPSQAAGNAVSGRVRNARTGAAMARVLVQANGHSAFTTAEGRFQLTDPNPITSVQFTKPGFALSPEQRDSQMLNLPGSGALGTLEVELWPEAVLTGTITSPEGDPLPHIAVTAQRFLYQNGARQAQAAGFTLTDSHGSFRLPVPAGDYFLETRYAAPDFSRPLAVLPAELPSHASNDGPGAIHIGSGQELHFALHAQTAAVFRVTLPIDGSTAQRSPAITVTTSEGASFQPPRRMTPDGVTLDLPSGVYGLFARLTAPEGERVGQVTLTVPDHDLTAPPLHLDPSSIVPIVVTAKPVAGGAGAAINSGPPEGAGLNLQLEPVAAIPSAIGETLVHTVNRGSAGAVFSVAPGSYRLSGGDASGWVIDTASFGGVDLLRKDLVIGPNVGAEPIRIEVSRATGTLTGVTRAGGVPTECWIVLAGDPGTFPRFLLRRSDTGGQFSIGALPFRRFHLLALPLLYSADFANFGVLDQFNTYLQTISVTASSAVPLTLDAVPAHELYP